MLHGVGFGGSSIRPRRVLLVAQPVYPPYIGGFDGPAELPRAEAVVPLLTFNPDSFFGAYTPRVDHTPSNAAELNMLLTGGTLNGNTLQRGDWITLTAGTIYNTGVTTQTFPVLAGSVSWDDPSTWVWVRSSNLAALPASGVRVSGAHVGDMPIFRQQAGGGSPPLQVPTGARGYCFTGLAGDAGSVTVTSRIFQLGGNGETVAANNASHIVVDRCHLSSVRANNCTRTILLNCGAAIVRDSHCYNTAAAGVEDQAIGAWNGAGPHLIDNNLLVAGGENILYGGEDPASVGLNPQDIIVRRNHLFKPLAWNRYDAGTWDGVDIVCKNLFELKKGVRVLVEHNVLENFWRDDQNYAINLKSVNQNGGDNTSECSNVVLRFNQLRNVCSFITCTPAPQGTVVPANRIVVHNNLVTGLGGTLIGPAGSLFSISTDDSLLRHNTMISDASGLASGSTQNSGWSTPTEGTIIHSNIFHHHAFGLKHSSTVGGSPSIIVAHGNADAFRNNTLVGSSAGTYPASTQRPATYNACGFVDFAGADFRLAAGSTLNGTGLDGSDPGADIDTLLTVTAGCDTGVWS